MATVTGPSPRQVRQLDFISQFFTDVVHVPGSDNVVTDALSRINSFDWRDKFDFGGIADAQREDIELQSVVKSRFVV